MKHVRATALVAAGVVPVPAVALGAWPVVVVAAVAFMGLVPLVRRDFAADVARDQQELTEWLASRGLDRRSRQTKLAMSPWETAPAAPVEQPQLRVVGPLEPVDSPARRGEGAVEVVFLNGVAQPALRSPSRAA